MAVKNSKPVGKAAVKYCGGCNPRFDRVALVAKLKEEFPQLEWTGAEESGAWLVLVVNGCGRRCASHDNLQGSKGKIVISEMEDYVALREKLACFLAQ